jgi:hypothetical protein
MEDLDVLEAPVVGAGVGLGGSVTVWRILSFGAVVVAPPAQRGHELICPLVLGPEVA